MTSQPWTDTYRSLAGEILARPARLGGVRLVAVDGGTGAGKTTFAVRLAGALTRAGAPTEVVHTDDLLDGWADQLTFWSSLVSGVLEPLAEGRPGRYRRYDWHRGRFGGECTVPVPAVLIVEGMSAARGAVEPWLTLSVFVTADPELAFQRVIDRDGEAMRGPLRRWIETETAHFDRDATRERADALVDGGVTVGDDPESEYVRLR